MPKLKYEFRKSHFATPFTVVSPVWHLTLAAIVSELIWLLSSYLVYPWATKLLIDEVFLKEDFNELLWVLALIIIGGFVEVAFGTVGPYLSTSVNERILIDLRARLLLHLRRLPMSYFHREQAGRMMALFTSDVPMLAGFHQAARESVVTTLQFAIQAGIVLVINPQLFWFGLPFLLLFVVIPLIVTRRVRNTSKQVQDKVADISGSLQESLVASREIRAFAREEWELARFQKLFKQLRSLRLQENLLQLQGSRSSILFMRVSLAAVYGIAALQVLRGDLTVGVAIASSMYLTNLIVPLQHYGEYFARFQSGLGAWDRISSFLSNAPEEDTPLQAKELTGTQGRIVFEHVCFAYKESYPVLCDITFEVAPGEQIAIVGPSGAGKSTLMDLLLRLYKPGSGRILIDGQDICEVTAISLRQHIGIVFQEPLLFNGSVRENIHFGQLDASEAEVVVAAKAAGVHDFIQQLPNGYETQVGDRGMKLSGGQRQRLAIARAILRNPPILILDEATAWLDMESERLMQVTLDRVISGRTTFVVAHRLSTVVKADRIIVLDRGRIVECGTHTELLAKGGPYCKLFTLQSVGSKEYIKK